MKPAAAWNLRWVSPMHREPRGHQCRRGGVDVNDKRGVCLFRRPEVCLDTHVQFAVWPADPGNSEPAASTPGERRWFREFFPTQCIGIEHPLRCFTAYRASDRNVMKHAASLDAPTRAAGQPAGGAPRKGTKRLSLPRPPVRPSVPTARM